MLTQEDLMAIATLLEPITGRLDTMEGRLDTMEGQIKELKKENLDTRAIIETQIQHSIKLLAEGHQQIIDSMVKPEQLEDVHPSLNTVENVVTIHSSQIRELQEKIG